MFGGHGHGNGGGGGGGHGHSHNGHQCNHNHSHVAQDIGFGDEDDVDTKNKRNLNANFKMMPPNANMMAMMMANAMKNNPNMTDQSTIDPKMAVPVNPAMMMMPQMTPEMMDMAKKMFEQRQQLMKEYMEKGGPSNPAALQEMMTKAAQAQQTLFAQFKTTQSPSLTTGQQNQSTNTTKSFASSNENETSNDSSNSSNDLPKVIPSTGGSFQPSIPGSAASFDSTGFLNANLNTSTLDDLINKRNASSKKIRDEEEAKILDAISKKDYKILNAVKATQYGVLERLKELIESDQTDPNQPDPENVYLLHWAAINNRLDIAKYLLTLGCQIDPIGGELETTPLNWAARSGHVQMVILLMQNQANPLSFDIEGFSTIHLATMFAHSTVVAYLLAKGIDADLPDRSGTTPLMFAAQRVHSRDPAQLLITFNARLNAQDNKGNTPLHYCVAFNNATVMQVLLDKGASLDIKNHKGQTPIEFALDRKKANAASILQSYRDDDRENLSSLLRSIGRNKEVRKLFTRIYPFFILFYMGLTLELDIDWIYKGVLIAFLLFFDKNLFKYIPMATALSFITWLYVTWIIYFRTFVFDVSFYSLFFLIVTSFSWYNFYKCWKTDPGILSTNRDQMSKTILQFVEQNEFSLDNFCTSCIIRKPLRSKHCSDCDRCVAKFDHHCPWVDNCIGQNNLKYFVGFLFWTPICLAYYMHGSIKFYQETCLAEDMIRFPDMKSFKLLWQFLACSSWVTLFTSIAAFNLFWISCLFICHLYQVVFIGLTTNERLNVNRYKHFYDKNGNYHNPFHFGFLQNLVDLIDAKCCFLKPTLINWKKEHDIQDLLSFRLDNKKEKYKYQEV